MVSFHIFGLSLTYTEGLLILKFDLLGAQIHDLWIMTEHFKSLMVYPLPYYIGAGYRQFGSYIGPNKNSVA